MFAPLLLAGRVSAPLGNIIMIALPVALLLHTGVALWLVRRTERQRWARRKRDKRK